MKQKIKYNKDKTQVVCFGEHGKQRVVAGIYFIDKNFFCIYKRIGAKTINALKFYQDGISELIGKKIILQIRLFVK